MAICGWDFAPITWWLALTPEAKASWIQAFGTIAAIWVTQRIASSSARDARKKEESDKANKRIGEMMALLVGTQQSRIAMMSARAALDVLRSGTDYRALTTAKSAIVVEFPHAFVHALRGSDIFGAPVRRALFGAAQAFSVYVEFAETAGPVLEHQFKTSGIGFFNAAQSAEMRNSVEVAHQSHKLATPNLDNLVDVLTREIQKATGEKYPDEAYVP